VTTRQLPYRPARQELPPVFLEIHDGSDPDARIARHLNGGLTAPEAAAVIVPVGAAPTSFADTLAGGALLGGGMGFGFLSAFLGGAEMGMKGDGLDAGSAPLITLGLILVIASAVAVSLLRRKQRAAMETYMARKTEVRQLRFTTVPLNELDHEEHRAEVIELGESLGQSREALMRTPRDGHASCPSQGEFIEALGLLARYALHNKPYEQRRARKAVYALANRADIHVHTGNPPGDTLA
jgi:hypothetical protein